MHIKEIYEKIILDEEIKEIYNKIEYDEANDVNRYAFHNFAHIMRVSKLIREILINLKYDDDVIYKALIAAYLHDVGVLYGKENHAERSYEFALKYFTTHQINFDGIDDVLNAIRYHSDGFDSDNIIGLVLIFSDKIDIQKDRFTPSGSLAVGNRQYTHITDINISMKNGVLTINYITDGNMDILECNEYYFTKKIFNAIFSFGDKINYKYDVLLDGEKWVI